eukprot:6485386-Amphidinium_carterae.3
MIADEDTTHSLPTEAFTGKRHTKKLYLDGEEEEIEDNWRFASAPSRRNPKPWKGHTTLEVLPEYHAALRRHLSTRQEPLEDEDIPKPTDLDSSKTSDTAVVLHRFSSEGMFSYK